MEVTEVPSYTPQKGKKGLSRKSLVRKPTAGLKRHGWPPTVKKKPKKPKTGISVLQKQLDSVFSRYIRLKYADSEGNVECYTCGHRNHWKKLQNGHYISRFYKKYRFDENNCRPQCQMCNLWKKGDIPAYRQRLLLEIGELTLLEMEAGYKELNKLDIAFYVEKIAYYKELVDKLQKETPDGVG